METVVGIVGLGYWGKILVQNLIAIKQTPSIQFDPVLNIGDSQDLNYCTHIIIAAPTRDHYILCERFLKQGKQVFCEKPLTTSQKHSSDLFHMAYTNNAYLFVDWEFVWNDHVHYIKNVIDNHRLGSLRSISMNRLNMGPVRHDTNARQDLAAHDISILYTLFSSRLSNGQWVLYRRNSNSIESDSCIGYFKHSSATIQINASWHYGKKDRECIFEFDQGFLVWDDVTQTIKINGEKVDVTYSSPVQNALRAFFNHEISQSCMERLNRFIEREINNSENCIAW